MADRDILFRIGVASHPETHRRLSELGESVKRTMQQVEASIVSVGNTARLAAGSVNESYRRPPSGGGVAIVEPPRQQQQAFVAASRGVGGAVVAESAAATNSIAGLRREVQELARDGGGVSAAFDLDTLIGDAEKLRKSIGGIDAEVDSIEKSFSKIDKESAKLARSGGQSFRDLTSRVEGVGNGVGKLASGLALLGAGGEPIKALVDSLVLIKGVGDTFGGFVQVASNVVQTFSLLGERSRDAARGQELLGERTRLSSRQNELAAQRSRELNSAGRQLVVTFRQMAAAEEASTNADRRKIRTTRELADNIERLIATERRRARSPGGRGGTGGRFGGAIGGAVAGGVATSAYDAVQGATGSSFLGQLASDIAGIVADNQLDRFTGGGGRRRRGFGRTSASRSAGRFVRGAGSRLGGLGRASGRILGAAGAAFSAVELGKLAYDSRTGNIDPNSGSGQFFGGIGTNRTLANVDRIFQRTSPFGRENDATRLADSYHAVDRFQKRANESRANRERDDDRKRRLAEERNAFEPLRDFQDANRRDRRAGEVADGRLSGVGAARANIADDARALQRATEAVADADRRSVNDMKEYLAALQRAQSVSERLAESLRSGIAAIREESSLRQAINRDSLAAAQKRIDLLDTESDRIRGIAKQAENQLLSGAQRFARLSDADQRKTLEAQQIANRGGQLTDKQRGLLDAIGTFGASDAAKRADLKEAEQKGFYQIFGREERQLVGASDRSIIERNRRELGAAQSRFGSMVQDAQRDGFVSLEERRGIQAARAELEQLKEQQRFARDGRLSERRSALGFSAQEAVQGAQRLGTNESRAQQLQVTVENKQQFEISLKTNEAAAVRAVEKVLLANQKGQEQRMRQILQAGLDQLRVEQRQNQNLTAQQGKNSRPT